MWKKLKTFIGRFISFGKFVHPSVDEELKHAINDKLDKRRKEQDDEREKYNEVLNSYLRTYFSTPYLNNNEMSLAFDLTNKKWKELCKSVNRKNKLINIHKEAFSNRVKLTIEQLKKNKNEL
jgi:hypothetical protein